MSWCSSRMLAVSYVDWIQDTPGFTKLATGGGDGMARSAIEGPLGRIGTKFDVGMMCVCLSSAAGAYVNGETIAVDGGSPPLTLA